MIIIQKEDFDIGEAIKKLTGQRTDIGAIVSFLGLVRDMNARGEISAMTLEHYPAMAQKELEQIEEKANNQWDLQQTLILHRYGTLHPGDNIVLVIAASPHRKNAFQAAQFMMDFLKSRAPFWKSEKNRDGQSWVHASQTDEDTLDNWQKQQKKP